MTAAIRDSDKRLIEGASRLRLPWIRDHMTAMLETAIEAKMTPREVLEYFFTTEIQQREVNRIQIATMAAHFPRVCTLESFDMAAQPSLDPGVVRELFNLEWVKAGENVLFLGPPGVGKTHLAIALGRRCIAEGLSARFYSAAAMLELLEKAQAEGCLTQKLNEINRYKLLIIDEIGYLPFSAASSYLMFQLVSKRYEHKSIVVTSNRPPGEWGLIFQDPTAATAILDRLIHHATIVTIRGDSYRATQAKKRNVKHSKTKIGASLK